MSKQTTEHPAQLTWQSHRDVWELLLGLVGVGVGSQFPELESQINHTHCDCVLQKHRNMTYQNVKFTDF